MPAAAGGEAPAGSLSAVPRPPRSAVPAPGPAPAPTPPAGAAGEAPRDWVLARGPVDGAVAAAALRLAPPGPLRVLLTGAGLGWLDAAEDERPWAHVAAVQVSLCSRSAREAGRRLEQTPAGVAWSSLAAFVAQAQGRPLGVLLP